ncbi:MAG: hypothetical protein PVG11_02770 [Anaerolineae bacterium]
MENTYTYTARSVEVPEQVVTFTLQDHHMSVGLGAPLEQIEAIVEAVEGEEGGDERAEPKLWLKPLAVSLVEQGRGPFRVEDVYASAAEDWLQVRAWYRAGGLALTPVTLVQGRVDNPVAAQAFVEELDRRKEEVAGIGGPLKLFDFWFTWVAVGVFFLALLQFWRRQGEA